MQPMSDEKMRAGFEAWAKAAAYDLSQTTDDKYWCVATDSAWQVWQAAYAAGRKAEREAIRLKNWDGLRLGSKPGGE